MAEKERHFSSLQALSFWLLITAVSMACGSVASRIGLGSRLLSCENDRAWVSENRTFAFGFTPFDSSDRFVVGIWFAQLPGDRTVVWSANRDSPVSRDATLELDMTGNLILTDKNTLIWTSNTSMSGVEAAVMSEYGNFILYAAQNRSAWQSFSYPSDTLLPNQPLTVSLELTSRNSPSHGGYYSLKMLQQRTSLSLALTYNLPGETKYDHHIANYSYWSGPDISNVTGGVAAVLDKSGSFGIVYGESSIGAVYVYKNNAGDSGLSSAANKSSSSSSLSSLWRLTLEYNGNLRLYKWDNDMNGSRQWVPEWAAVSNPCGIAGVCGKGICSLDRSKSYANCRCLPGTEKLVTDGNKCSENLSPVGQCDSQGTKNGSHNGFKVATVQETKYYFTERSVAANFSDISTVPDCGDACLANCECVASVYGLHDERPYCWILRSLDFGGFEDPGSTLFVKVKANGAKGWGSRTWRSGDSSSGSNDGVKKKVLVVPIVLTTAVLAGLLCCLLYYNVHKKTKMKRDLEHTLIVSGSPIKFSYRDLQIRTSNFSQQLGTGGFGSVYKGSLGDGTLVAVKKLDRVLPHGEKEFITEVNTIGSMHHMNLVRLCGYCSEGSHRLLVYEFMKNGSLDQWIFQSYTSRNRLLDWPTRLNIAIATAQGIAYFHEQCRNRIIHCDIKPENILLDDNFCPKVSDFGLAKLMGREHSQVMTMVRGTRGYLAPEWVSNRPITVKADVYSYGMLLLEIIGGRRNLDMSYDAEDFFYPSLAFKEMKNGTPLKAADRKLRGLVDEEELMRALKTAFWCIQDEVAARPSMGEIVRMLDGSMDVNRPPMPQTVSELVEEGLDHVYRAMKRESNQLSSFTVNSSSLHDYLSQSQATCSYSTMSPR